MSAGDGLTVLNLFWLVVVLGVGFGEGIRALFGAKVREASGSVNLSGHGLWYDVAVFALFRFEN